jgi:hypothetical protein
MGSAVDWTFALIDKVTGPSNRVLGMLDRLDKKLDQVDKRTRILSGGGFGGLATAGEHSAQRIERAWGGVQNRLQSVGGRMGSMRSQLIGLVGAAAGLAGIGMAGKSIVDAAGYKQDQLTSLTAMLGGGSGGQTRAAALYNKVQKFASATPFETRETLDAAKQNLSFGFKDTEIANLLKREGSLASGTNMPLQQVVMAFNALKSGDFGQAFGAGQGFSQLGIGKPDLLKAGLKFDKSGGYLGTESQGMRAVLSIIDKKFGNSMDKQSTNISGLASTLTSRPFELFSSLTGDNGKSRALQPLQDLMQNLGDLSDFSKPPGSTIQKRFEGSMTALTSAIFGPLAKATSGQQGVGLIDMLLDKVDQFSVWWAKNGPMIMANAKGIWDGLVMAFGLAKPLLDLMDKVAGAGKADDGGDPKDSLPSPLKAMLDGGLVGKALGFIGGIKVGLAGLDAATFGASTQLLTFAGAKVLGLLNLALDATKVKLLSTNFAMEILTNPAGKLAGLRVATAAIWAQTTATTALGAAALSTARLEILTNPAGRMAGLRAVVAGGWSKLVTMLGLGAASAGGIAGVAARLGPIAGRALGLITSPIGIVIGAITVLKTLGDGLYNSFKPFADLVDGIYEKLAWLVQKPQDASAGTQWMYWDPIKAITGQKQLYQQGGVTSNAVTDTLLGRTPTTNNFMGKLAQVAKNLGIDPGDLLMVMNKESGVSPSRVYKNSKGETTAAGLIQFQAASAGEMGTSLGAIQRMSREEQLPFVEKYLRAHGVKPGMGLDQLYMSVLSGNATNPGLTYAPGSINGKLDTNRDGTISAAEAAADVRSRFAKDAPALAQTLNITINGDPTPEQLAALRHTVTGGTMDALTQQAAQQGYGASP